MHQTLRYETFARETTSNKRSQGTLLSADHYMRPADKIIEKKRKSLRKDAVPPYLIYHIEHLKLPPGGLYIEQRKAQNIHVSTTGLAVIRNRNRLAHTARRLPPTAQQRSSHASGRTHLKSTSYRSRQMKKNLTSTR